MQYMADKTSNKTRKTVRDHKPPPTPCCSPGGITIFGSGVPYLPMVKKSENQNSGLLPEWITPKIKSFVVFAIPDIP